MKKNALLALTSTLLTLVVAYGGMELYLYLDYLKWKSEYAENGNWYGGLTIPSENPGLLWEYRANGQSRDDDFPEITTNEFGFRDGISYEKIKNPGSYRISVIGDSVALGYGVKNDEVFTRLLDERLDARYPDRSIEVLNHGIDGYSTPQILELLRSRVLEFDPDRVLYVMCLNDFDYEDSGGKKARFFTKPPSLLWSELERIYRKHRQIDFHRWHYRKNHEQSFSDILAMSNLLDQHGIEFNVVIVPVFKFNKIYRKKFDKYRLGDMHEEIGEFLEQNSIEFIDLLPDFAARDKPASYFGMDIWHPTVEGHRQIAISLENLHID